MWRRKNIITKHHIIPQSKIDKTKTSLHKNHPDNIVMLRENTHNALHILFENQTPKEQLETLFNINKTVLSRYVQEELIRLFCMDDKDFYK